MIVQGEGDEDIEAFVNKINIVSGDVLFLCLDGNGCITNETIVMEVIFILDALMYYIYCIVKDING